MLKDYWRTMATRKTSVRKSISSLNNTDAVNEFMNKLEHPLKSEMEAIRTVILSANNEITEGIKWNAPSFYFNGYLRPSTPEPESLFKSFFIRGQRQRITDLKV
jgi:hypothetical protein